ncbi:MAG: RNA methyltransferase [Lentisphaerae bacterium RIFOXYA12_FULL_48_11]|nr:MAG: RNA methyltransferase [Lentisphaerae bacterium RIFOXYA12_FULL_48_11]
MTDFSKQGRILITCAKAMPQWLSLELRELGFPVVTELDAAVVTTGSMADAMKLNISLRTAHRVLFSLKEFQAPDAEVLYKRVLEIPWEEYVPADGYLCINSKVSNETINDPRFATLKCKDAIVDRIRSVHGKRPDSGSDQTGTVVFLYWQDKDAKIYLDTSGEPLSRRGYRKIPMKAPMQETLAAGVILATGWRGEGNMINPMCGSGTLAIEAALLAQKRQPGLLRTNFGFEHIVGFDPGAWKKLRTNSRDAAKTPVNGRIIATDIDPRAVEAARKNAQTAGVDSLIEFAVCDFTETEIPQGGGIVVLNPEYGERLDENENLTKFYFGIGDFLKQKCEGYRGYVFTGNLELAKRVGLRSKRRIPFFNSRIECRLLEFELYSGTKRKKNIEETAL